MSILTAFGDELSKIANSPTAPTEQVSEEDYNDDGNEGEDGYVYHSGAPIRVRNNKRMKNELASIRRKRSFLRRDE